MENRFCFPEVFRSGDLYLAQVCTLSMILDFFPGCKMLFTQISPLLQCHNLCKFHHRQEISRRTAAFPAPCGMGNGFSLL